MSEFEVPSGNAGNAGQVLETLRERALVRLLSAANFDWRHYLTDEVVTQYDEALQMQGERSEQDPALTGETLTTVGSFLIEVYGGVAEVTSKPEGVEVEIIDHDNEEQPASDALVEFLERADMPQPDGEEV